MADIKIVPAICPQCGADIHVNKDEDAAICEYCGRAFIVEGAIERYDAKYHVENMEVKNFGSEFGKGLGEARRLKEQRLLEEERNRNRPVTDNDVKFIGIALFGMLAIYILIALLPRIMH